MCSVPMKPWFSRRDSSCASTKTRRALSVNRSNTALWFHAGAAVAIVRPPCRRHSHPVPWSHRGTQLTRLGATRDGGWAFPIAAGFSGHLQGFTPSLWRIGLSRLYDDLVKLVRRSFGLGHRLGGALGRFQGFRRFLGRLLSLLSRVGGRFKCDLGCLCCFLSSLGRVLSHPQCIVDSLLRHLGLFRRFLESHGHVLDNLMGVGRYPHGLRDIRHYDGGLRRAPPGRSRTGCPCCRYGLVGLSGPLASGLFMIDRPVDLIGQRGRGPR